MSRSCLQVFCPSFVELMLLVCTWSLREAEFSFRKMTAAIESPTQRRSLQHYMSQGHHEFRRYESYAMVKRNEAPQLLDQNRICNRGRHSNFLHAVKTSNQKAAMIRSRERGAKCSSNSSLTFSRSIFEATNRIFFYHQLAVCAWTPVAAVVAPLRLDNDYTAVGCFPRFSNSRHRPRS